MFAGALCLALSGNAVAEGSWKTVSNPERSFSIEMPGTPRHSTKPATTGRGDPYTMNLYVVEVSNAAYVVQAATYPASVDTSNPRRNLQSGIDNAAKNNDGQTWKRVDWISVQGLPAVDAEGARDGLSLRMLMLLDGHRVITAVYAGPAGSANSADVSRFLKSLRLAR
jgi:hypothetical protein